MEYRIANHHIGKFSRKWHFFDGAHSKIFRRQPGSKRNSEQANVLNAFGIRVHCKHLAAFAKQVHQVSPISAPSVEHAHTLRDISAQDLIEHVNIDLAELVLDIHSWILISGYSLLDAQRRASIFLVVSVTDATGSQFEDR
jgi:hypothetical protein